MYRPGEWRWNSSASLAETIVPWAALWLYYYEAWQVTGVWYGPEAPHSPTHPKESE
ncbi:MAG: hypothetical protein U0974_02510 [Gemmatimonadales bacterium]|nr:hypothetical protein [Gemmatimonadales bacterium]MDZ4388585.1 hypothetical protein [Gemmatimonadales bacterium]